VHFLNTNINNQLFKSFLFGLPISVILYFLLDPFYPQTNVIFSLLSLTFVLSVIFLSIYTKNFLHVLFLPIISLSWIYFESPFLKSTEIYYPSRAVPEEYYFELAFFPCIGIIVLYISYYKIFSTNFTRTVSKNTIKLNIYQLKKLIILVGSLSLTHNFLNIFFHNLIKNLGNTIQILSYSGTIILSLFILYWLRGGRSKGLLIFVCLITGNELIGLFLTTLFGLMLKFFLPPLFTYFYERKKIPVFIFILILILIYPIYLTRFEYRYKNNLSSSDNKIATGLSRLADIYTKKPIENYYESIDEDNEEINRFENVSYLGQCVYLHEIVGKPFYNGKTFWWLPLAPIPRFILPWKPENLMATKIAYEYGVKQIDDKQSAFNFPMLVEGYINFGFLGIVFICLLQGVFFKLFFNKIAFGSGDINLLILLNSFKWITHMEGNITLVFGGILQIYIFWWLIIKFFKLNEL
jgi:hypothetical protein